MRAWWVMGAMLCTPGLAAPPGSAAGSGALSEVRSAAVAVVGEADADRVVAAVEREVGPLREALGRYGPASEEDVRGLLADQVVERLRGIEAGGIPRTVEEVERTVVAFEAFKARSYVTSGVFPKRYFGFVDGQGDTAALELRLARAVAASTEVCNAWLAERGHDWRVTDQEIAVTWIAEGGALLLTTHQASADRVHPILGIGLDDIAHGFKDLEPLVRSLDARVGTDLASIPTWDGDQWGLSRFMTFEETIAGTAAMWVWEKEIADRKLRAAGRPGMDALDRTDQFVVGSLVYNSGIVHSPARPAQVRRYALAGHLSGLAARHNPTGRTAHLPVSDSAQAAAALLVDHQYPEQGTSWIALYHILQRYGAYEGLERYTETFDDQGRLRPERWDEVERRLAAEAEARAAAADVEGLAAQDVGAVVAPASEARSCGCGVAVGAAQAPVLGLALGLLALRRRRRA